MRVGDAALAVNKIGAVEATTNWRRRQPNYKSVDNEQERRTRSDEEEVSKWTCIVQ